MNDPTYMSERAHSYYKIVIKIYVKTYKYWNV